MTLDSWLHLGHVLGAMVWLGGGLMLIVLGSRARGRTDPKAIGDFGRTLTYVGPRVLVPAVVAVLVSGVWMVLISAEWNFAQLWVLIALGLFAVTFLIGAIYLSRIGMQFVRIGESGGDPTQGAALLSRWMVGYGVVLVLVVIAVWDMIFKPGL